MTKKLLLSLTLSFFLISNVFSAGSSGSDSGKTKTDYDKAVSHINLAKKYEKKGKTDKANKRYEKALKQALENLRKVVTNNGNVFEELMTTVKYCSLGEITHTLFQVGGKYRRSM